MLIKVDEDLPKAVADLLRARGFEASTVLEEGLGGAKDSALWAVIQREEKYLVTADKGFGDLRSYPPGTHAGVLLLRPDSDGVQPLLTLVELTLSQVDLTKLHGTLAVVTPRGLRLRGSQPPITQPHREGG